ncbi:MAG: TetR/AcrR family transcriptional regulator [Liquorilactobacillus nagelii]|jgi:AcrR family transcriptional regulator|uniref:TetR/AcrR family transcriptional regulator n=1 Tax=Liquorilactobacillus nagelii TaxID=82688 RepID=UPI00242C13C2|nr:TetR/AcrR family transcriptional regulator [Liquorilactobacillus nagelii]MCI1699101.1 TetR/AcrR family transcriptional regulator [Liquorilactobacillus nagelii]
MERQEAYIAALHLIEEKGPSFTMAELARKMKVSKRTIYQHFTSKADLLNQTIDYVFDDLLNNKSDEPIETNNSHLSPLEILQLQLQKLPNVYDLDKLLRSSKSFSTNYPEQWARVNRRLDQLGSRVFQMLLNNPRVRILTATEKKVLLISLQQSIHKLVQGDFLEQCELNFHDAILALNKLLLEGILY